MTMRWGSRRRACLYGISLVVVGLASGQSSGDPLDCAASLEQVGLTLRDGVSVEWCVAWEANGSAVRSGPYRNHFAEGDERWHGQYREGEPDGRWTRLASTGERVGVILFDRGAVRGYWEELPRTEAQRVAWQTLTEQHKNEVHEEPAIGLACTDPSGAPRDDSGIPSRPAVAHSSGDMRVASHVRRP